MRTIKREEPLNGVIYKTTNEVNQKVYIGKTIDNRPDYLGSGLLITRALSKYGESSFTKEVLDRAKTIEELNRKEKYWIKYYNATNLATGYNITSGGDGGDVFSNNPRKEEIRKRCSTRRGPKNGMFGRKHTKQSKEKMSRSKEGQGKGVPTWNKGLKWEDYPEEYRKKLEAVRQDGRYNPKAKRYKVTSPLGKVFCVHGELFKFAREKGFFPTTLYYFIDKGVIPPPSRKCSKQRLAMTGWEIEAV